MHHVSWGLQRAGPKPSPCVKSVQTKYSHSILSDPTPFAGKGVGSQLKARTSHSTRSLRIPGAKTEDMSSAAFEAFRKCSADLIKVVQDQDVTVLAWELFSAGVVSNTVVDGVNTVGLSAVEKKTKLLSAVGNQIDAHPAKFQNLLQVLRKQPPLSEVADKLEDIYRDPGTWLVWEGGA